MAVENDLVLIYLEDNPLAFARIESILADAKPDWYHVKLLMLQVPPQIVTWILRDIYIDGQEFTMNGKRLRLEKVVPPVEPGDDNGTEQEDASRTSSPNGGANVISLAAKKKS